MILLVDNYDSFSYNLYQLIGTLNPEITVLRNDKADDDAIGKINPDAIILSPGPGRPADAGYCEHIVSEYAGKVPILGVCLGHQAICEAFGGKITYAHKLMHGKQSDVTLDLTSPIFNGLPEVIPAARYHSLAADAEKLPDCLKVIARTADDEVMAVEHKEYPVYGLQFHPESIMTPDGNQILKNFLEVAHHD